jgi:DNA polymerase delta subunit 3
MVLDYKVSNFAQDMFALATVNLEVFKNYASEDPLLFWKQYGTTQNPNVTRRSGTEALIGATIATSKAMPLASKASAAPSNSVAPSANAEQAKPRRSVASKDSKSTTTAAPPKLKSSSSGKGDIFASFSKASAKPKSELKQPDKPKVADVEDGNS